MAGHDTDGVAYEDALVQVIRIFAARGRAIRQERERQARAERSHDGPVTGNPVTVTPSSAVAVQSHARINRVDSDSANSEIAS